MVWSENFHFKPFTKSCTKRERDRTQREIEPRVQSPSTSHPSTSPFDREIESHPDRTERDRRRTQSPSTSHPSTSSFDREIESHRERSLVNPEPRSRLRLRRDRTPRSHRDGTNHTDRTEIAIEKWLGFDEFDRIWLDLMNFFLLGFVSVFIYWKMVLYICLEAEKMWGARRKCVFYIIFSNTTKH